MTKVYFIQLVILYILNIPTFLIFPIIQDIPKSKHI